MERKNEKKRNSIRGEHMKSGEFMYWLQGYFELTEATSLDEKQTIIIKRHLDMVKYHEKNKMHEFCAWFAGFLDLAKPSKIEEDEVMKIREKLDSFIQHVVPAQPSPPIRRGMSLDPYESSVMIKC